MELDHRTSQTLTDFGKHLYSIMFSRDMRTFAEVSRMLEESGKSFSRQAIAYYANGKRAVPWTFVESLVEVLHLSYQEQQDLAWHYAYGQKKQQ